jgi:hypothetical protein
MKLTNGKKIIERNEQDYKKNLDTWTFRGWKPVSNVQENIKEVDQTFENETKVVPIKSKKKKAKKK